MPMASRDNPYSVPLELLYKVFGRDDVITREELYALVWSKPMIKVAEPFEVSGSYMARVCSVLRVPRPTRGYWAKLAVGKAPPPRPLPEVQPGDQITWSKDGDLVSAAPRLKPAVPPKPRKPRGVARVTGIHGLLRDAKTHFETSRPVKEGEYLRPYKKLLVDVTASKTGLDKALAFTNDLFNALESAGHRVVLAPSDEHFRYREIDEREHHQERQNNRYPSLWSPGRRTVVYVGTVAIGLVVVEMSEAILMRYVNGKLIPDTDYVPPKASRRYHYADHTWTTTQELPCGRLRLIAYSPYWQVSWSTQWQETRKASLTGKLPAIVKAIENAAVDMVEKLHEAARLAEIERQKQLAVEEKWRQEEDRRKVQQSIADSQAQLRQIIQAWSDVMNVERFLQGVQDRAHNLPTDERSPVLERLKLAREFVGTQNPLEFFLAWRTPLERYQPLSC